MDTNPETGLTYYTLIIHNGKAHFHCASCDDELTYDLIEMGRHVAAAHPGMTVSLLGGVSKAANPVTTVKPPAKRKSARLRLHRGVMRTPDEIAYMEANYL